MIILLETGWSPSGFRFETSCTGRRLQEAELRERGFISDDILRRYDRSIYTPTWFEVKEGDQIRVVREDDDEDIDVTFIVPAILPDPPVDLFDKQHRTGMWVYDYLVQHCVKVA